MPYVQFEPHDPAWFDRFERVAARVETVLDAGLRNVYHVGSTAVPDLPAKPTLDAVAVFDDRSTMATGRDLLIDAGYEIHRDDPEWIVLVRSPDRDTAAAPAVADSFDVCLHLRPFDHRAWCDQVVFREYLRDDVRARATYDRAKRAAAESHPDDVDAYVDAKEATIRSLVEEAYDRGYVEVLPRAAPVP